MTSPIKIGLPLNQLGLPPMELAESSNGKHFHPINLMIHCRFKLNKSNCLFQNAAPDF